MAHAITAGINAGIRPHAHDVAGLQTAPLRRPSGLQALRVRAFRHDPSNFNHKERREHIENPDILRSLSSLRLKNDDWGRMTSKSRGSASASYEYRYGHYLADASSNFPGEAGAAFLTGGDGKRRSSTVASVDTHYRWDAGYTVLNELDGSGDLERTYVGRNTAQIESDDAATGDYFYHTHDHLGSTRQVFDESKVEVAEFKYTPYGRDIVPTNRALTTRGYTGHTREAALGGAYYAPFRYYMPSLARWEKRDPLGLIDGPNVYGYVRGNPASYLDPLGQEAITATCCLVALGGTLLLTVCVQQTDPWKNFADDLSSDIDRAMRDFRDWLNNLWAKASKRSGKEKKNDLGDDIRTVRNNNPRNPNETCKQWATRLFPNESGPTSRYSRFLKWCVSNQPP